MHAYLSPSPCINVDHPQIQALAKRLESQSSSRHELIQSCFEFVRDQILHSADHQRNPITCKASDVLEHRTGFCYAKSHLLAALLRANGVPAGLCYQRLSIGAGGPPYCLHGLNAVHLPGIGWYRIDARGNKPGVNARFCPPEEALAFSLNDPDEHDCTGIWAEPLAVVVEALEGASSVEQLLNHLPDAVLPAAPPQSERP